MATKETKGSAPVEGGNRSEEPVDSGYDYGSSFIQFDNTGGIDPDSNFQIYEDDFTCYVRPGVVYAGKQLVQSETGVLKLDRGFTGYVIAYLELKATGESDLFEYTLRLNTVPFSVISGGGVIGAPDDFVITPKQFNDYVEQNYSHAVYVFLLYGIIGGLVHQDFRRISMMLPLYN